MTSIHEWVAEAGGLLHKRDLVARGAGDRDLTRAVREGEVRRPRRGWYSTFSPDDLRFRAARAGGRLTGQAALEIFGAWTWNRASTFSVSVPAHSSRLTVDRKAVVAYDPPRVERRGTASVVDPRDALVRALAEVDFESAVALWDWALACEWFSESALDEVAALLPLDRRGIAEWGDAGSDSVIESVGRVRLLREGHTIVTQHPVPGASKVDLVVDGTVAIELDGREFHQDRFESDRRKDLAIVRQGWLVLRGSYSMVRYEWAKILAAVRSALELHVRPLSRWNEARRSMPPAVTTWPRPQGRRRLWRCRASAGLRRVAEGLGA
ncbi:hypothetical protein AX769_20220 [Frondihabitans sp. PAMC 28766]|uniref:type IV toxin-antitoxin system AbiEi family antitoxin domain-containing protein n=1 Tax=Frondihabitans sp. PAMC 28766 TaxID=1795630 RepID=UPI00078D05EF|nr:type IV toxin-antitoxin system AbiEi family antitoxin domain-containing protein [Frondihabitans sp. PAMC 28766]AMM22048.1 hypothetical protein AX769_20220 [Frondihabitans sp. PAMC 28766]